MKKIILIIVVVILYSQNCFSEEHLPVTIPSTEFEQKPILPEGLPPIEIPDNILPNISEEIKEKQENENGEIKEIVWKLEKKSFFPIRTHAQVAVPLEIISDIDIKALIIDDQKLNIPFQIEMNKEPDKLNYYSLNYSEKEIDIDNDGSVDTIIYSPKYINKRVMDENYVIIDGKNISKEGTHRKKIYINVEIKSRR